VTVTGKEVETKQEKVQNTFIPNSVQIRLGLGLGLGKNE
jgi:hypothetical protein